MTTNRDLTAAWTYHNHTKHSLQSLRSNPHFLDWDNYPLAFKIYSTLDPIPLPQDLPPAQMPTLGAIASPGVEEPGECIPQLSTVAVILYLSAGITKRR